MEEYLQEKAEIGTHILKEEWEDAHRKALELLQKNPEDIDFLIYATAASAYGSFFQDTVNYGTKVLQWAQDNGKALEEFNSLDLNVVDVQDFVARAYFGLQNYSDAKKILDKITAIQGVLPDSNGEFAVKNEYMLNGAEAAFYLANQLEASFLNKNSEDFYNFRLVEAQICYNEMKTLVGQEGLEYPEDLPVTQLQKIARYLLRLIDSLDDLDNSLLTEDTRALLAFGKNCLFKVAVALYKGNTASTGGQPEMQAKRRYMASQECIMSLEKLSESGNGSAQYLLGNIYAGGYNTEQDNTKAFDYFKLAYENGESAALVNLAFYYDEGIVTEKDAQKALEYAKRAAEAGDKKAYGILGKIYADSFGDIEQGLVWLKKGFSNGDEMVKNILLKLARENVDNFDDKIQFVLDMHKRLESDINALGAGTVSDLGRKYVRYYMEIEKYYMIPADRLRFINVCLNVQVDLVTAPRGIVSGDYFIDQFEKLIAENREMASIVAKERGIASRISNLALIELAELGAAGKSFDMNDLNWSKIKNYYFPKALELGWDGYYADGSGPWKPDSFSKLSENVTPLNQSNKIGFATMDSYDSIPTSKSNSGGCYIATAVYGSYDCPEVWILRRFRDYSLAKSIQGQLFIKIYYTVGPMFVKLFGNTIWFRRFWKSKLDKIVQKLRKKGYKDTPYCD